MTAGTGADRGSPGIARPPVASGVGGMCVWQGLKGEDLHIRRRTMTKGWGLPSRKLHGVVKKS
jgi:hypothetical protein